MVRAGLRTLGLGVFTNTQIDRLGERLRSRPASEEDLRALSEFKADFILRTDRVARQLSTATRAFRRDITARLKSNASIVAKLKRETCRLSQLQDIGGVRITVSKVSVQDRVVQSLRELYPTARVVDRRAFPQHGYRGVHVIVEERRRFVEVQVRTSLQSAWAQASEKYADLLGEGIKYGRGPVGIMHHLERLSKLGRAVEDEEEALDAYKRTEISELHRRRREGSLMGGARKRLEAYERARKELRDVRTALRKQLRFEAR